MYKLPIRKFCASRRRTYPAFISCVFVILIVTTLIHLDLVRVPDAWNPYIVIEPLEEGKESTDMGKCVVPQLDPFRSEMMNLFKKLPKLECKGKRFAEVIGRQLRLKTEGLKEGTLQYIRRPHQDDFNFELSTPIPINFKDKKGDVILEPREEFIQLTLTPQKGETVTELHTMAMQKPNVDTTPKSKEGLGFNVAFVLIDSISSGTFHRAMSKSLSKINSIPTSVVFKGHTIVGDGTTAQMCAIFTGINEQFLPETRRGFDGAVMVDEWPIIYKDFKKNGYVTMFSEDMPLLATFNFRLKGFRDPPSDHYARPFFLAAEKVKDKDADSKKKKDYYCVGAKPTHLYSLDYVRQFFDAYPKRKRFSFSMMADISHNTLHDVQLMDEDLVDFINEFEKKHLDNTMLVILGDHGPRGFKARSTFNGKLEERLPFLSITMPKSFKKNHSELFKAMKSNADVLTSHFDLHATLKHVLEYPKIPKVPTGQSLFLKIDPDTRNCHTAGVADHWCPCLAYRNISVNDPDIKTLALKAVAHVNSIITAISKAKTLCAELKLKKIIRAGKIVHNQKMVDFVRTGKNGRCDTCMLVLNKAQVKLPEKYEIVFAVSPSDGMYEMNVSVDKGNVYIDPNISRINLYGNQPECLAKDYPHLRKYCFCVK